jgi:hypothetical protein
MSKLVSQATDLELLQELISRNGHDKGPFKTVHIGGRNRETLVAIGKDHTAHIHFDQDALPVLCLE